MSSLNSVVFILKRTPLRHFIPAFHRLFRVRRRKRFALSYYDKKIKLIGTWSRANSEDSNFYYDLTPENLNYLAHFIANLTNTSHATVMDLFLELESNTVLRGHIRRKFESSDYEKEVDIKYGRRLGWYAFVRILKPKLVVETGVDHGVGACVIAQALILNSLEGYPGKYLGTDINPKAGQVFKDQYSLVGEILFGDSVESLEKINEKIDLFINDSDHSSTYEYSEYKSVQNKLSSMSLILGDNAHATTALADFSLESDRTFHFFKEVPQDHWYPGAGIGVSK